MSPGGFKYASLPQYTYQPVERHYQTFDFNTASYYTYPISIPNGNDLTAPKVQDDTGPSAEQEKETPPTEAAVEEPTASPDETPAPAENAGKCLTMNMNVVYIFRGGCYWYTRKVLIYDIQSLQRTHHHPSPLEPPTPLAKMPKKRARKLTLLQAMGLRRAQRAKLLQQRPLKSHLQRVQKAQSQSLRRQKRLQNPQQNPQQMMADPRKMTTMDTMVERASPHTTIGVLTVSQTKIFQNVTLNSETLK